ncbi:MAG: hypothetical protein V1929_08440 [bacterium]
MKTVVVIVEGVADVPRKELEGRTPLAVARCPVATRLASEGRCGLLGVPGSDKHRRQEVLMAALCGVPMDEALHLNRGPLELAGTGAKSEGYDFVYAGNYVTMDEHAIRENCLSRLSVKETAALTESVQSHFDPAVVRFVTLAGSRVLVLVKSEEMALAPGTPPALVEDDARAFLPPGKRGELACTIMDRAAKALADVTINDVRLDLGENPATHLWLWGGGKPYAPKSILGGQARKGCVLTQSWMARGFARAFGMDVIPLEDPWAEDAEDSALDVAVVKGRLKETDFLLVFIEAPQKPAGYGTAAEKVRLLERMDLLVLAPLVEALAGTGPCRVLLTSDGVVPARADRVPAVLWGEGVAADAANHWDEASCGDGDFDVKSVEKAFGELTGM